MSLGERETDDEVAGPEGPPRWPAPSSRPVGSHHPYPAPDGEAPVGSRTPGPSTTVIAVCLGLGISLFALGVALMTIVL